MGKLPSFQFYPGDWMKDPDLSRASLKAKGALIEILCLAFGCDKRGYLKTGSKPWTIREIAIAIRGDVDENEEAIGELLDKKILKKDKKGTIFSARMVRDENLRKVRREAGSKGGNPNLLNQKPNQTTNQKPTPSAAASSSASIASNTSSSLLSREKVFEFLRMATIHKIPDEEIHVQTEKFLKKYSGEKIENLRALCNSWAANIKPPSEIKPPNGHKLSNVEHNLKAQQAANEMLKKLK